MLILEICLRLAPSNRICIAPSATDHESIFAEELGFEFGIQPLESWSIFLKLVVAKLDQLLIFPLAHVPETDQRVRKLPPAAQLYLQVPSSVLGENSSPKPIVLKPCLIRFCNMGALKLKSPLSRCRNLYSFEVWGLRAYRASFRSVAVGCWHFRSRLPLSASLGACMSDCVGESIPAVCTSTHTYLSFLPEINALLAVVQETGRLTD